MTEGEGSTQWIVNTLKDLRDNQLKKDEVFANVTQIVNEAIDVKVTKRMDKLDTKTDKIKVRLTKLEQEKSKPSGSGSQSRNEAAAFMEARKSLILMPCEPTKQSIEYFLRKQMRMPTDVVETLKILSMEEVFQRNLPPNKQKDKRPKAQILLKTVDQRDMIMSYATNLSKGANVEMVIPCHLKVTARRLEHHAYKIRQASKEMAGNDKEKITKTQVRFDNLKDDLVLGIREGKDVPWKFLPMNKLQKLVPESDSSDSDSVESMDGLATANDK